MKYLRSIRNTLSFFFNLIRYSPHIFLFYFHKNRHILETDMDRGFILMEKPFELNQPWKLIYFLSNSRHFRNLFYFRTAPYSSILNIVYPQMRALEITTKKIGEGLVIIHGYSSMIGAESIGKNCVIYQQVTIGGTIHGAPILMDNVIVYAGAIIIGKITIGNNVVVGANATVFMNVPDNCTVLPGSSKIMKWGKRNPQDGSPC